MLAQQVRDHSWPVKGKKYVPEVHFPGGEVGSGVRDMASTSLWNLGAKFSEMSFPHFTTYFTQISRYL